MNKLNATQTSGTSTAQTETSIPNIVAPVDAAASSINDTSTRPLSLSDSWAPSDEPTRTANDRRSPKKAAVKPNKRVGNIARNLPGVADAEPQATQPDVATDTWWVRECTPPHKDRSGRFSCAYELMDGNTPVRRCNSSKTASLFKAEAEMRNRQAGDRRNLLSASPEAVDPVKTTTETVIDSKPPGSEVGVPRTEHPPVAKADPAQPSPVEPAHHTISISDQCPGGTPNTTRMNGKPVILRHADTVLTIESDEFHNKLLCDGLVVNLGDACGFTCTYCYVESAAFKFVCSTLALYNQNHGTNLGFQDVVIRRANAIGTLRSQLLNEDGTNRYSDPTDTRVVYTSTLVDPAANKHVLRETAEACNMILKHTPWQIRILTKSALVARLIEEEMIPKMYHDRLIIGFSIGTLDDKVARAIEVGASPPSKRIEALNRLQDLRVRTFGMICPSLPQKDYDEFSKAICEAIRVDKCEHVWAEVLNVRGESKRKTLDALQGAGLTDEAERFKSVFFGNDAAANWEEYARRTFEAHTKHVPAAKLRFLQYLKEDSVDWWKVRRADGAVLIGDVAKLRLLQAGGESAPSQALVMLNEEDVAYRDTREQLVQTAVAASFAASEALHEIHTYKDGILWKQEHPSFEHYCLVKWHYAKSYAYRLLGFGSFINELKSSSPLGVECKLPLNLGQVRSLLELVPKCNQVPCWQEIVEVQDVSNLTGPMVEKAARAYVKKEGLASRQKTKPRQKDDRAKAIRSVVSLRALLNKLPEPGRFKPLTQGLLILLGVDDTGADLVEAQPIEVESEILIDGSTAAPTADMVPDTASKVRRTPKPGQSPTPAKKIEARSGSKAKDPA